MDFNNPFIPIRDRDLDLEFRKYRLLAYLQRIGQRFREKRLYAYLNELKDQYSELISFKGKKDELSGAFPRELKGFDLEEQRLLYRDLIKDEDFMDEIDRIVDHSLPRIKEQLEKGEELRHSVMDHIEVRPVGLLPLRKRDGYLLLSRTNEWRAYRYGLKRIQDPSADRRYRDLRTRYVASFQKMKAPDGIKEELMKEDRYWSNPAVFWIECDLMVPHIETLLPIAKQVLMRLLDRVEA